MKILCVDDFKTIHHIVKSSLETISVETLSAFNGELALKVLEKEGDNAIDLILLDWYMPGMSGIELLENLKSNDRWKSIPVIMLTSEGTPEMVKQAMNSGAISYLVKPFALEDLIAKVMQCSKDKFQTL